MNGQMMYYLDYLQAQHPGAEIIVDPITGNMTVSYGLGGATTGGKSMGRCRRCDRYRQLSVRLQGNGWSQYVCQECA